MASNLNDQLQRLAAAAGINTKKSVRGKASLLHDFQSAADIGLEDVYEVALSGFDKLCRRDARFQAFSKSLFGKSTLTLAREQQVAEVNAKLDTAIGQFCKLLSPHFLTPPAFQTLEYLVRRFRVHELNVSDLMKCALPYHFSKEFVRLVYILNLERTPFEFLTPMQKSGAPLPREALVTRCLTDRSLLRFVCDMASELANPKVAASSAMPFYGVVLCEVISNAKQLDESLVAMLMPYILAGLGSDVLPDYRSATYMVLTQLSTRATMAGDLVSAILITVCKTLTPGGLPEGLLLMAHMAVTQPHLTVFPERAFKHLAKLPGLALELNNLVIKYKKSQPLLTMLATVAVEHLPIHANYVRLLTDIIVQVPLSSVATFVIESIIKTTMEASSEDDGLVQLLQLASRKYPVECDVAVDKWMRLAADNELIQDKLLDMLQKAFNGTARAPLSECGTTLSLALDSANPAMRQLALQKLESIPADSEDAAMLHGCILRRMMDDEPAVAVAALSLSCLDQIQPVALLEALESCLQAALNKLNAKSTSKHDRTAAKGVAKKALRVVTTLFSNPGDRIKDRVASLLLATMLATEHSVKLATRAVNAAGKLDHVLLDALKHVDTDAIFFETKRPSGGVEYRRRPKQTARRSVGGPPPRVTDDKAANALNKAVIRALSEAAEYDEAAGLKLQEMTHSGLLRAKLLLLAASKAVFYTSEGNAVSFITAFVDSASIKRNFRGWESVVPLASNINPGSEFLTPLAQGEIQLHALHAAVLLIAIQNLTGEKIREMQQTRLQEVFNVLCQQEDGPWMLHLQALTAKVDSPACFLSEIFGTVSEGANKPIAQASALDVLVSMLEEDKTSSNPGHTLAGDASNAASEKDIIPRLLCALGHPQATVRSAALRVVHALTDAHSNTWNILGLEEEAARAFFNGLYQHQQLIQADAESASWLLQHAMEENGSDAVAPTPTGRKKGRSTPASGQKKTATKKSKKDAELEAALQTARLSVSSDNVQAMKNYLIQRLKEQTGLISPHVTPLMIRLLQPCCSPGQLLKAALPFIQSYVVINGASVPLEEPVLQQVAGEVMALSTPEALAELGNDDVEAVAAAIIALLQLPTAKGTTAARRAAVAAISSELCKSVSEESQRRLFMTLTRSSAGDEDDECRAAAHAALAALPISAKTLAPLLAVEKATSTAAATPEATRRRQKGNDGSAAAASAVISSLPSSFILTLEVLQWKENIVEPLGLVPALQELVETLMTALSTEAAHTTQPAADDDGAEGTDVLTSKGYAMQLTLNLLQSLVVRPDTANTEGGSASKARGGRKKKTGNDQGPFDIGLALRCAQTVSDGGVRNSALSLVGALAATMPEAALDLTLDVVAVVGKSAATLKDAHSHEIAAQTLGAVIPAWVDSGKGIDPLIDAVVEALPGVPIARRLPVVSTVVSCLPAVQGVGTLILSLLQSTFISGKKTIDEWPIDLSRALMLQTPAEVKVEALASLLDRGLHLDNDPTSKLSMLIIAFVTEQLQKLHVPTEIHAAAAQRQALLPGCDRIMQGSLLAFKQLGAVAQRKQSDTVASTTAAIYSLLEALQRVSASAAFVSGLVSLTSSASSDKIRSRALTLLSSKVIQQVEDGSNSTELSSLFLQVLEPTVKLLSPSQDGVSDTTRQSAVGLIGLLARYIGSAHVQTFVNAVSPVLALIVPKESSAVRASALATVATLASSLKTGLVPVLPKTASTVVQAVEAAVTALEDASEDTKELAALELAAALSALVHLVEGLGAFLAPHLAAVLQIVLNPTVLNCQTARCSSLAASVRAKLAEIVPPRLLLGPLIGSLDTVSVHGAVAMTELLTILNESMKKMDASAVASYHESVFSFLLKALDLRRTAPAALKNDKEGIEQVEAAAVAALVALTMQLSETRFRPLFYRFTEWAEATPPGSSNEGGGPSLARRMALFSAANALAEQLRSVFVPYFKALIDPALDVLASENADQVQKPVKKKAKRVAKTSSASAAEEEQWQLKLKTIRALHRCFLYDTVGFLSEARFERLLDPLVAQLHLTPPVSVVPALERNAATEGGLEGRLAPEASELDEYGRAIAACLGQMAITAGGGDARWRPLNHAVLMASRSEDARTRLLSLETVAVLAGGLGDEYLPLLPEALPFLAELLEDVEGPVERRAAGVVKALEELSGEDLAQYMKGS